MEFKDFDYLLNKKDENQEMIFNDKRLLGENDNLICEIIRKNMIDEFLNYIQQNNYSLSSNIPHSIFETNAFLLKRNPTLIEYSAFFGSFNIFKYLVDQDIDLTPSIWIYAIHSQNKKIIDLLKQKNIQPESYDKCFIESLKYHHNELALYFKKIY